MEELRAALQRAAAHALSRGVTTVVDMGRALFADAEASWRDLEQVYIPSADSGQLPIRVRSFVPLAQWGRLATKVVAQVNTEPFCHADILLLPCVCAAVMFRLSCTWTVAMLSMTWYGFKNIICRCCNGLV